MAPPPENGPFSVEKMKIFKNGWTVKASKSDASTPVSGINVGLAHHVNDFEHGSFFQNFLFHFKNGPLVPAPLTRPLLMPLSKMTQT